MEVIKKKFKILWAFKTNKYHLVINDNDYSLLETFEITDILTWKFEDLPYSLTKKYYNEKNGESKLLTAFEKHYLNVSLVFDDNDVLSYFTYWLSL